MIGIELLNGGGYRIMDRQGVHYVVDGSSLSEDIRKKVAILMATDVFVHVPGVGERLPHSLLVQERDDEDSKFYADRTDFLVAAYFAMEKDRHRGKNSSDGVPEESGHDVFSGSKRKKNRQSGD